MSNSEASVRAEALESLLIDKGLIDLGPLRIIIVAVIMLVVTMVTHEGLTGAREQFRAFRKRKSGERRARRTIKGGEVMPEEATEIYDKQEINKKIKNFGKILKNKLNLDVIFYNEDFSSNQAQADLAMQMKAGRKKKINKEEIDRIAAALILQSYFENEIFKRADTGITSKD